MLRGPMATEAPRRSPFQTRTDIPFEVYLPSEAGVQILNKDAKTGVTYIDDTCTPFLIRSLSYKEREGVREQIEADFPRVEEELNAHLMQLSGGKDEISVDEIVRGGKFRELAETEKLQRRVALKGIASDLALVKLGFMGVEGEDKPDGGWHVFFHPESDVGIYPLASRAAQLTELAAHIREASELGPKASRHFKARYGSLIRGREAAQRNLGAVTDALEENES